MPEVFLTPSRARATVPSTRGFEEGKKKDRKTDRQRGGKSVTSGPGVRPLLSRVLYRVPMIPNDP